MNFKKTTASFLIFFLLLSFCTAFAEPLYGTESVNTELEEYSSYTVDNIMQAIYTENSLYNVLKNHSRVRAEVTCYLDDESTAYTKIIEVTYDGTDTFVRISHKSDILNGEMEGSSQAGYIACQWDDGSIEAACSLPDEFLPLIQETYLTPYENVSFDNVSIEIQDDVLLVAADMHYNDGKSGHTMYYYLDREDLHLIAVSDDYAPDVASGSYVHYLFAYDEDAVLEGCGILDSVMNADDAKDLSIVYIAPEYGFSQVKHYKISESVTPNLDSRGYFNLYTSPELKLDSEVDNIDINGDTTIYAVITTYMLKQQREEAAAEASPAPVAASSSTSTNITVTKSPTPESPRAGGTAYFNATATNYDSIVWNLIGPDGTVILATDAANYFGGLRVYGCGSDTLVLENVPKIMDGWSARCTFINSNSAASSETAKLTVADAAVATPTASAAPVLIEKTESSKYKEIAQQFSTKAVADVQSRIGSWGWTATGVSSFNFDETENTALFGVNVSCGDKNATFYFNAYPVLNYYVPVGFDSTINIGGSVSPFINRTFCSTTDTASCWAAFGDGVVALSSADQPAETAVEFQNYSNETVVSEQSLGEETPAGAPVETETVPVVSDSTPVEVEITPEPQEEVIEVPSSGFTPGQNLGSGYMSSMQSDLLVLHVSWNAVAETSNTVLVTLSASLESRSITTCACALAFNVDGQDVSFYTSAFEYEDTDVHYTPLGSYTFRISADSPRRINLTALWNFNGSYHGQPITNLYCMDTGYIG